MRKIKLISLFCAIILCFVLINCGKTQNLFKSKFWGIFIQPESDPGKSILLKDHSNLFTNEYGKAVTFYVYLNNEPTSDVVVGPIRSLDNTEGEVVSSSFLKFTSSNYNTPQAITIKGLADGIVDGNVEYRINFGTVSTGDKYYSSISIPELILINTDKETSSIVATPSMGLFVNESGSTTRFSVVLSSQPGADVTIPGFISNLPSECIVSSSLTFTNQNWNIPQEVVVIGIDDSQIDGNKTCQITSQPSFSTDQSYANKTISPVSVVNLDNDSAGFSIVPITATNTSESGGTASFFVVMNTKPFGNVSINGITTSDPTEGTVSPANIAFTPTNWNEPHVLTVTGINDYMNDGDIDYTIVFPNSTSTDPLDFNYNGKSIPSAGSFTNLDNDTRGVTIVSVDSLIPLSIIEGSSKTFQVRLNSIPCDTPVAPQSCNPTSTTIHFTNSHASQFTISPSSLTFSPGDWNVYQTVTVTAINDEVDDDDYTGVLVVEAITGSSDYNGFNPLDITVQTVDNDTAQIIVNPVASITVNENDPGGSIETTITVRLSSEPTHSVTIGQILSTVTSEVIIVPTSGNTAITNRTLVFTPTKDQVVTSLDSDLDGLSETTTSGWNVPQTIRVRAFVDGTLDGNRTSIIRFLSRNSLDTKYGNTTTTPIPDITATNIDSGTPQILIQNISALSFAEDGTSFITVQVRLATLPAGAVTIPNITSSDTTEGVLLDTSNTVSSRVLVFTPNTNDPVTNTNSSTSTSGWNVLQTITIRSVADDFDDGDIPFFVQFPTANGAFDYNGKYPTSSEPNYNSSTGRLSLTNVDNDTRGFTVTASSPIVIAEGGVSKNFTIGLNSLPCSTPASPENCTTAPITVNLINNDLSQYTITSGSTLTFNSTATQTITVQAVNDDISENQMNFTLEIPGISGSNTDYDGLNPNDVAIRIPSNDTKGISLTNVTGFEDITSSGGGYTEYNLKLNSSPALGNTVSVTVSVPTTPPQEGKILDSNDATQLDSRVFTFTSANWSDIQTFRVRGLTGAGTGSASFVLTASATETGTIPPSGYTNSNYNNYNGVSVNKTITNYHIGSAKKIRIAGSTTSLNESATGGAASAYFWILFNSPPTSDVTINFGIDSSFPCTLPTGTKQFDIDTASLTIIHTNWNQLVTSNRVQITRVNDDVDDGDVQCPLRILSTSSADLNYNGLTSIDFEEPNITVIDNDVNAILISSGDYLELGRLITSSSGGSGTVQIKLSTKPLSDVTLTFSDISGLASYSPTSMIFTPSNYNTNQILTVTGQSTGSTSDDDYTIIVTASSVESMTGFLNSGIYNTKTINQNATNRYHLYDLVSCASLSTISCAIANVSGGVVPSTYFTSEAGASSYFGIKLRAKPTSSVTIPFVNSNSTEGSLSTPSLTFTNANWNILQVVQITGVDDFIIDGSVEYNISFSPMSGDPAFTSTIPGFSVFNTDND